MKPTSKNIRHVDVYCIGHTYYLSCEGRIDSGDSSGEDFVLANSVDEAMETIKIRYSMNRYIKDLKITKVERLGQAVYIQQWINKGEQ